MTKIIGLTGGIGSGKTTVAHFFNEQGVPVYIADTAAKKIMTQEDVIHKVVTVFGKEIIDDGQINRKKLADIVFENPEKLKQLNKIIHPAVSLDFENWVKKHHQSAFVIKEAAILFESGSYVYCDKIITVTAPLEVRIQRVMQRDNLSRDDVLSRMAMQWDDSDKIAKSDFVIENIDFKETKKQISKILKVLYKL